MLTSWPALSTAFDGDWVIRLANGYTKRANSVTCLAADDRDLDTRIDRVEAIYGARGLPAVFRLSPLASPALEAALDRRGWRRFDETVVMTCDLDGLSGLTADVDHEVRIGTEPDQAWLESCDRIAGSDAAHLATLRQMLARLVPPAGFGRIEGEKRIEALGLVVVDADFAGLFDVLTVAERRRQGLAGSLVRRLFAWSTVRGARTAWLSVLAHNQPARGLYQRLGFAEVYRYHHRANR
ncbi:MAG: GNAT family N-acetyltransferase [Alphaproteobacteria bacterium]